eukprot:snap_masked-scaffold_47-processed-gene-1.56-mRNA-1 protein AED:1.00 eAED:1.00 QI:0/0/0/0/1/1/2/0/61
MKIECFLKGRENIEYKVNANFLSKNSFNPMFIVFCNEHFLLREELSFSFPVFSPEESKYLR